MSVYGCNIEEMRHISISCLPFTTFLYWDRDQDQDQDQVMTRSFYEFLCTFLFSSYSFRSRLGPGLGYDSIHLVVNLYPPIPTLLF